MYHFMQVKKNQKSLENGIKRIGLFIHLSFSPNEFDVYNDYKDIPRNSIDHVFIACKTTSNKEISSKLNENEGIFKDNGIIIIFKKGFEMRNHIQDFSQDRVFCARVITGFIRPKRNSIYWTYWIGYFTWWRDKSFISNCRTYYKIRYAM